MMQISITIVHNAIALITQALYCHHMEPPYVHIYLMQSTVGNKGLVLCVMQKLTLRSASHSIPIIIVSYASFIIPIIILQY